MLSEYSRKIGALFEQHGDEILRTCFLILKNRSLAEDAAIGTYEKALSAYGNFKGNCSERTWLIRIAVNICRDMLRSHAVSRRDDSSELDFIPAPDCYDRAEKRTVITDAVTSLSPPLREAAVLCLYNGFSAREASKVAGISPALMSYRLGKAKKILRNELKELIE